jgi:hypothetical protein
MSDQAETMAVAPKGQRLDGNFGPGTLRSGVRNACIKAGEMLFCGTIVGIAYDFMEHPNAKDPTKISTRFIGKFMANCYDGKRIQTTEAYLPSVVERTVKAIIKSGKQEFVPVSGQVWAEPDDEATTKKTAQGFRYVFFDLNHRGENDPLLALAYETGVIERPVSTPAIAAPETQEVVDPETGEITREPVKAAAANVRQSRKAA